MARSTCRPLKTAGTRQTSDRFATATERLRKKCHLSDRLRENRSLQVMPGMPTCLLQTIADAERDGIRVLERCCYFQTDNVIRGENAILVRLEETLAACYRCRIVAAVDGRRGPAGGDFICLARATHCNDGMPLP